MHAFNKPVDKFWLAITEKGDNLFSRSNSLLVEQTGEHC